MAAWTQEEILKRVEAYANNGPWKVTRIGACGDITHEGRFYGSLRYRDAREIVKQLNQRWRWVREQGASADSA